MKQINDFKVSGNIGSEPIVNEKTGQLSFSLANNASYKKGDEWIDKTNWFNVFCDPKKFSRLKKGDSVIVYQSSLSVNQWEKDGQQRISVNINAYGIVTEQDFKKKQQDKQAPVSANGDLPF
jgi:hypothetical protein